MALRTTLDGTNEETIAAKDFIGEDFAFVGNDLFFSKGVLDASTLTFSGLVRLNLDTLSREYLGSTRRTRILSADATGLYFRSNARGETTHLVYWSAATKETVIASGEEYWAISGVADGDRFVFSTYQGIYAVPRTGGVPTLLLSTTIPTLRILSILGKHGGDLIASDGFRIWRIPLAAPNAGRVISEAQSVLSGRGIVDANDLYAVSNGRLARIDLTSGTAETVVEDLVNIYAVDNCYVYWVPNNEGNEVWRKAR